MSEFVDLSVDRILSLREAAAVLGLTSARLATQAYEGRAPVKPKLVRPLRWSSIEIREWLADARKRAL